MKSGHIMDYNLKIGLPRMHNEPGEKRDFLPDFVARLVKRGARITLDRGYGSGIGYTEDDYLRLAPTITFADHKTTYEQDYVLVLRCPQDDELRLMKPGACLISMLHFPTRPKRVKFLKLLGLEAVSLDSIKDDTGRRFVENLRSVAWNGLEIGFEVLKSTYPAPGFESPDRPPIHATLIGAGAVGSYVVQAATRYGNQALAQELIEKNVPGVILTTIDRDITNHAALMRNILADTDILIDATQRPQTDQPVIPNQWVEVMPKYSVIVDLSVDPYDCAEKTRSVKAIEGIPQGNLDQYIFAPGDPAFDRIPQCVNTTNRRHTVSCYSWPGIHPKECMAIYGEQIRPLIRNISECGGVKNIHPDGYYFHRAISRAMLSRWPNPTDTP